MPPTQFVNKLENWKRRSYSMESIDTSLNIIEFVKIKKNETLCDMVLQFKGCFRKNINIIKTSYHVESNG